PARLASAESLLALRAYGQPSQAPGRRRGARRLPQVDRQHRCRSDPHAGRALPHHPGGRRVQGAGRPARERPCPRGAPDRPPARARRRRRPRPRVQREVHPLRDRRGDPPPPAARGGEVSPSPLTGEGYGGLAAPAPGRSGVTFEEKEASSKARQLATRASCAILLPPWEKATDRRSARTGWPSVRPFCATAPVGWPARERRPSFALRAKPGAREPVLDDHARRIALAQRDHIAVEADISRRQAIKVVVVAPLHCRAV